MPVTTLPPEHFWLTLTCLLTGLLWVPYILQLILQLAGAGDLRPDRRASA